MCNRQLSTVCWTKFLHTSVCMHSLSILHLLGSQPTLQQYPSSQSEHTVTQSPHGLLRLCLLNSKGCLLFVGLIDLVSQQLTAGPCQGFRRPTAPSDSLVTSVPAMAAFAKAALDGGIEYESVQGLYQASIFSSTFKTAMSLAKDTEYQRWIQAIRSAILFTSVITGSIPFCMTSLNGQPWYQIQGSNRFAPLFFTKLCGPGSALLTVGLTTAVSMHPYI